MDICKDLNTISKFDKCALTIGVFDGIHCGHMEIIRELKTRAEYKNMPAVVVTFDPHPKSVLKNEKDEWKILMSTENKLGFFEQHGIDYTWVIPFDKYFSQMTANRFIKEYIMKYFNPADIIIGCNHHFGFNREGGYDLLAKTKSKYNYEIHVLHPIEINEKAVSSSQIRSFLREANIDLANKFLGREYAISGTVIKGNGRGKEINFPTANLQPHVQDQLIPFRGVYSVDVNFENRTYPGMCNIGSRPTFYNNGDFLIEVHLITDSRLSMYNKEIIIKFKEFIREEKKYASAEDLVKQLQHDRYTCTPN